MYTFLINKDNSIYASHKEVIMQRSKLVDAIQFLIPKEYKENDMSIFGVTLEYILPVSKEYHIVKLVQDEEEYKDYLKYVVPLDTNLTSEAGDIQLQLTFVFVGLDADGKDIQKVRKTEVSKLHITPIAAWSDIIPDAALSALDQRILKQDSQIKALEDLAETLGNNMVDNLKYNEEDETLQLQSKGDGIGDKVSVKDMIDDGIPVVDFGSSSGSGDNSGDNSTTEDESDVVEF